MFSAPEPARNYTAVIGEAAQRMSARATDARPSRIDPFSTVSNTEAVRGENNDLVENRARRPSQSESVSSIGSDSSTQTDSFDASLSLDLGSERVSPQNAIELHAPATGATRQEFEIKIKNLPVEAPFLASQISIQKRGEMSRVEASFYAQVASAIQGFGRDAQELKHFIKRGDDPSKATGKIHDLYIQACTESPAFGAKLESLYKQLQQKNVLTGDVLHAKSANRRFGGVAPFETGSFIGSISARETGGTRHI